MKERRDGESIESHMIFFEGMKCQTHFYDLLRILHYVYGEQGYNSKASRGLST